MNVDNGIIEKRLKYEELYGHEPCDECAIEQIEKTLGIKLPNDFKLISDFYSGGSLGGISHYDISSTEYSILTETLRLRNSIGLLHKYVVIAEPASGLIVLNVDNNNVIWCDATDAENLNTDSCNNPDVWNSYAAFFDYLLDEES